MNIRKLVEAFIVVCALCFAAAVIVAIVLWPAKSMAADPTVTSTRKAAVPGKDYDWICQGSDGTFISGHTRQDKAQESCANRALAAPGAAFVVMPGASYEVMATVPPVVITPPPVCPPEKVCPVLPPPGPVLDGTHGVWTWVAPTLLENGNILTDLDHYLMWRQPPGGTPEIFAQVNGKATRLIWGMDTSFANACFYIVAVRKPATSPPVPSDKSNTICMDAAGQFLPQT